MTTQTRALQQSRREASTWKMKRGSGSGRVEARCRIVGGGRGSKKSYSIRSRPNLLAVSDCTGERLWPRDASFREKSDEVRLHSLIAPQNGRHKFASSNQTRMRHRSQLARLGSSFASFPSDHVSAVLVLRGREEIKACSSTGQSSCCRLDLR